jgi:hypothetical protein
MRMPGFYAEASLYRNDERYWLSGLEMSRDEGKVLPAEIGTIEDGMMMVNYCCHKVLSGCHWAGIPPRLYCSQRLSCQKVPIGTKCP